MARPSVKAKNTWKLVAKTLTRVQAELKKYCEKKYPKYLDLCLSIYSKALENLYQNELSWHDLKKRASLFQSANCECLNRFDGTVFARRTFGSFAISFEQRHQMNCPNLSSFSSQTENRFVRISHFLWLTVFEKARLFLQPN